LLDGMISMMILKWLSNEYAVEILKWFADLVMNFYSKIHALIYALCLFYALCLSFICFIDGKFSKGNMFNCL
jgi:hypothetical protein